MEKQTKKGISILKKIVVPTILIVTLLLPSIIHFLFKDDARWKEGDLSNTPYAVQLYTSDVEIDDKGNISNVMTVQEIWDKMIEDGSRVDKYLNGPEELQKLINAQRVTDYLDTRKNPDEEIDWEELNKNAESKDVQGIIKLKRAKQDGSISTLTYIDPQTFQTYIDEYNKTGSKEYKEKALSCFTLQKEQSGSYSNSITTTEGIMNIPYLNQGDSRYSSYRFPVHSGSTIANNACGIVSTAMVLQYLTGKDITVEEVATWADNNGHFNGIGSNGSLMEEAPKHWNVGTSTITMDKEEIEKALKAGKPVISLQNKGIFTQRQHFIVLTGIDSNGKTHVNDPASRERTATEYDLEKDIHITSGAYWIFDCGTQSSGNGEQDESTTGTNIVSTTFSAKIATWSEITEIIESDDPSVKESESTTYNMTSTKINYQEFVSGYSMPFDYLWTLLVISQDKEFVFELANLIYDSEIEITVHDNLSEDTKISVDTYTNKTKVITDNVKVKVSYISKVVPGSSDIPQNSKTETKTGGPFDAELEEPYTTTHKVITKTNTLDVKLTKADVWIVKYMQEVTHKEPEEVNTTSDKSYKEDYPDINNPNKEDNKDTAGLAEKYRKEVYNDFSKTYDVLSCSIQSLQSKYYYSKIGNVVINNTVKTTRYVASPAEKPEEKTDKTSIEPNFVTILIEHKTARDRILSAKGWLFEILESSPNTESMVDLTRYLLYKTTGKDFGVTEFDFSIFDPKNFKKVEGISSMSILKEYIRKWENAGGAPTNADGTKYIIESDGAGHPTVGYGVDIFNGGYKTLFEEAGYPTHIGGEVDIEFVDALEDEAISSCLSSIRSITSGLNLQEYQIHALVSRSYNCGVGTLTAVDSPGAVGVRNGKNFVQACNAYWKYETDDYYEERNNKADFSHLLYTQYMNKPVTSKDKGYMRGLEERRKSEWTVFQTGYYDRIDKWYSESRRIGSSSIYCGRSFYEFWSSSSLCRR